MTQFCNSALSRVHHSAQWQGYIKDYDGGTLMECLLDSRIPHVDIPQMVRAQRAALDSRIRGLSQSHVVYRGLQHFDEHGRRQQIDIMSIPGAHGAPAMLASSKTFGLLQNRLWANSAATQ